MTSLPEWMRPQSAAENWNRLPDGINVAGRRKRRSVARRTAGAFARFVAETLGDDTTASRQGLLQGVDPRFKVIGLVGLLVVVTLVHSFTALVIGYAVCVGLAVLSGVSARRFARVWLVVPLFSAALMLPATLSVVTQGSPVWTIWRSSSGHDALAVTDAGLIVAGRFVLRTGVCVSLALLLSCTTSRPRLFHGLRALGVPRIFIMLLSMMERYLGVLVRSAEEIHLAKISRSVVQGDLGKEQAWVAAGIGSLFRRTYKLSQTVYMAMISRGYTGEVRLLDPPRARSRDWMFLVACVLAGACLWAVGA
ncbi:MAG: cobalt ECF transporter T component CbiQ [Armatimonadetes bacterium]|nr:cobalt ECF transporter T component CbiQ [Armatimonadota bacterium]